MSYVSAKANVERRDELYQYHISSVLCMIAENTAKIVGDGGRYSAKDYYDIIKKPIEEKRTGREIVDDLASKMGLEVVDKDGIA